MRSAPCALTMFFAVLASGAVAQDAQPPLPAAVEDMAATADPLVASVSDALEEPAEVPLAPLPALLRDSIASGGPVLAQLDAFYAERGYQPVWDAGHGDALLAALAQVSRHGLPPARYEADALAATLQTGLAGGADDDARVAAEIAAARTFVTYAHDINSGMLEPREIDRELTFRPHRADPSKMLADFFAAPDADAFLSGLAPQHPQYAALLDQKVRLEALIQAGGWGPEVPAGKTMRPGQAGSRVLAMRQRLSRILQQSLGDSDVFDEGLVIALKQFQDRHGLNADGVAGPATLAALNRSPEFRLEQVLVNLERQRWMNFDRGYRHIFVNQADFSMAVYEDGKAIFRSRTIIGKAAEHRTPEFYEEMTHMVVNPTWHVPRSIVTEEYLPRLQRNPGSLPHLQVMTRSGTRINPRLVNFGQFTKGNFPFIMKQAPGSGNALGRVKFMFPNQYDIYLHDTPTKPLFARDVRDFSHGCVRVQRPFELAHLLLSWQTDEPEAVFERALAGGRERHLDLAKPVPIYLTYQTAWVDDDGVSQFREDVYGRDRRIFGALADAGVTLPAVEG